MSPAMTLRRIAAPAKVAPAVEPRRSPRSQIDAQQTFTIGETAEPCGVPLLRCSRAPSGRTSGAASHRFTYNSTQRQSVTASTALTTRSQETVSKNFWTSRSITQSYLQHRARHAAIAWWADLRGR